MKSMINSGWIIDKNAVDDERVLQKGMSTPIIRRNPGKSIERIKPIDIPSAYINQGEMSYKEFMQLGLNAEALGMSNVESAKLAKLKQAQGLANVGELTDNFNYAFTQLGRIALSMIFQYYTLTKIKKILGREYEWVTQEDLQKVRDIKYDIEVDETTYSPVQKAIRLETLMEARQYGIDVTKEEIMDQMDMDAADIVKYKQKAELEKQQMQQQQQQQSQMEQMLLATKAESEKAKTQNLNMQSTTMGINAMEKLGEQGVGPEAILRNSQPQQEEQVGMI